MARVQVARLMYEDVVDIAASPRVRAASRSAVPSFLASEGLLVGLVGVIAGVRLLRLSLGVTQDTWLSLLAGRAIADSGIPHRDLFTYWALGKPLVDQQWLAHLTIFGVYRLGGLVLLGLLAVVVVAGTTGGAVAYARHTGATARTAAWLLAGTGYAILIGAANIRAQLLVLPLFVAVLALAAEDARAPSRRVFAVLPLLVLWANLHGSVVVGVALVVLRAAVGLLRRDLRRRSLALAVPALLAPLATPYGWAVVDYYHRTLLNRGFGTFVTEWRPLSLNIGTAPILLLAAASIWLAARRSHRLGHFAVVAELLLVALAFAAVRNVVWLGLGSLVLLAPALDAELGRREGNRRLNIIIGVFGVAFALLAAVAVVGKGSVRLSQAFPAAAGNRVAQVAAEHPNTRILADERFADWLMFEHPNLVGRLAYDASFEQLTVRQMRTVFDWKNELGGDWRAAGRGARIIVVGLPVDRAIAAAYRRDASFSERYRSASVAVFVRS